MLIGGKKIYIVNIFLKENHIVNLSCINHFSITLKFYV